MADNDMAEELQDRLVDFGVRVIKLADALPSTPAGKHIAGQVLRSGTSPAANYAEARAAESRGDFVHILRIVHKELNETFVWLQMVSRGLLLAQALLGNLAAENDELCRIVGSSIKTAKRPSATSRPNGSLSSDPNHQSPITHHR